MVLESQSGHNWSPRSWTTDNTEIGCRRTIVPDMVLFSILCQMSPWTRRQHKPFRLAWPLWWNMSWTPTSLLVGSQSLSICKTRSCYKSPGLQYRPTWLCQSHGPRHGSWQQQGPHINLAPGGRQKTYDSWFFSALDFSDLPLSLSSTHTFLAIPYPIFYQLLIHHKDDWLLVVNLCSARESVLEWSCSCFSVTKQLMADQFLTRASVLF